MKIHRLQIGGFGRLQNRELELKNGVTVLYGNNEAGKSTTLQFIRSMLFGIPGRVNPAERYEPAMGGQHGGLLSAYDRDGSLWTIRRFTTGGEAQGKSEKLNITVSHPDGSIEEAGQTELERRLLGGISRTMFRQLFAVSLDELQQLGALQSEEMSSYLFHAGMGGGGEIMRAERRLLQEADKLYKPKGKVQEAAKIIQRIEKLERQIVESRSYLPRYNENIEALAATERELELLEQQRRLLGGRLVKLRKAQDIRSLWLKWRDARLELEDLPVIEAFPENGAARWQSLEGDLRAAEGTVFRLERLQRELDEELQQQPLDVLLMKQGPRLEGLDRRRASYEDRRAERQRLEGELTALQEHLQRVLRSIGADWSAVELAAFPGAAADREAARRFAQGFAGYDRRMEAREAERQQLRSRLAAAAAALQAAERALAREHAAGAADFAGLAPRSPREMLQLWDELQQAAERWREALLGAGPRSGQHAGGGSSGGNKRRGTLYRRMLMAGTALTLLVPAALWLTGAPPVRAWTALGLLAAADLALWAGLRAERSPVSSPPGQGGDERAAATEMLRLRGLLLSGAEPERALGRPGRRPAAGPSPEAGGLEAGMKELRRLMEAWNLWRQRVEKLSGERDTCRMEVETLTGQERALAAEMNRAEVEFTELARRYEEWLRQHLLPEGLSPEGLPDIFALVEQGNELLRQESRLVQRVQLLEAECSAYEQEVLKLMKEAEPVQEPTPPSAWNSSALAEQLSESGLTEFAVPATSTDHLMATADTVSVLSLLSWVELRKREWDQLKVELLRREGIRARVLEAEAELVDGRRELEELRIRCGRLLKEGGAADGEEFLRRSAAAQRRNELIKSLRQWELAMFSGWEGEGATELQHLLEQMDAAALDSERLEAEAAAASVEEKRSAALQHRGKLLQEREYLRERCMEDSVFQQLEEQRAALKGVAEQYAVAALTAELIGRTRRIYEQEKQPHVLRLASEYFAKLTGGEYLRIVMTLGHKELKAEHKDTGLLDSGRLSRGTAEQLYLAIRLALAETMSRQANLPLLFDDLFVNFDERRLHAALALLGELSSSRQIVMMTCHRHVAEATARMIPTASVVNV